MNARNRLCLQLGWPILAMATLAPTGCKKPSEAPAPTVYVQAVHPAIASISEEITADATLTPLAQAAISPRVTSPIKQFLVQRGSKVHAGQLLAVLEDNDLSAAVEDSKGSYAAAKGTYETAIGATVEEDYSRAAHDVEQARATLELNQSIVKGRAKLFAEGAIPGRDLDTANAALVQAQATYDLATQHLAAVKKVSHRASIDIAQGQLTSAKGKYAGAEAQLRYTKITSPIDGIVTDRPLFVGETAAAGTPVITIMDTSALIAKLHIAQALAQQMQVGASAKLEVPGIPDPLPAKVSLISPALDPGSTTVEVWLRIENSRGTLRSGTAVHATITGRTVPSALTLPTEAILSANDGVSKSVMVIAADGAAKKRPVKLGIVTTDTAQVIDGLSQSDMVITTGAYGLDEGTKVKIGTPPDSAEDKPAAEEKSDPATDKDTQ